MLLILSFVALSILFTPGRSVACNGSQMYSLQFQGMWSAAYQPLGFPAGTYPATASAAHFSPVVVAAHSSSYIMWRTGMNATMGVAQVSMSGMTTNITSELNVAQAAGTVMSFWEATAVPGTGTVTLDVMVNASFSLLSVITMIAPSSDWFVGVDSQDMCDTATGIWKKTVINYPLAPNDAGASPPNTTGISTISCGISFCNGTGAVPSMATVRINTKATGMASSCTGSSNSLVKVMTNWTADSCLPLVIPGNPHFSPLVCAVHSSSYVMWQSGMLASPGVKTVAETGVATLLLEELAAAQTAGSVLAFSSATGPIATGSGMANATVMASQSHPYLSCIAMIAPSPDWFIGISGYDMCGNGSWKTTGMWQLNAYDAGTDSGVTFGAANNVSTPATNIALIMETTPPGCATFGLGSAMIDVPVTTITPTTTNAPTTNATTNTTTTNTTSTNTPTTTQSGAPVNSFQFAMLFVSVVFSLTSL